MSTEPPPTSERSSTPPAPASSPWQRFYASVLRYRRRRAGNTAKRLPRPVLSIGNLHWGGGGKTPVTAAVAKHLRDQGHRVVILSRGHGRKSTGPLVVSRGHGAEVAPRLSGDEPALLARIKDVAVVVGERRYQAGQLALRTMACDLFLLDDGFSHVRLARDLELLLFPAAGPLGGARLLPFGRLREPLEAVHYANAVLLTGLDPEQPTESNAAISQLRSDLAPFGWQGPTFGSSSKIELAHHRPIKEALLVCAVANGNNVWTGAQRLAGEHGFSLASPMMFRDHHAYPRSTLRRINRAAHHLDTVLVTGKDLVKLHGHLELPEGCQVVEIQHEAHPQDEFFEWLDQRLSEMQNTAPASTS